ncbi:class I SAM-dependent methyltransferase [Spirosoma sp. SC4-14]|uniref:class I SAM-dependent DNA methyltransferase n=1 Tax=Spirosoma sp. SC4-14 TaxID=3128900 RepID=UPI0030CD308C
MKLSTGMNKQSYNKIAQEWAAIRNNAFVSKLVIDFAQKVNRHGHILDIGCGTGSPLAQFLSDNHFFVTGIDASDRMIEIAQSAHVRNAEFSSCDFFDFESPRQFDGVLAWDSFFHFPKDRQHLIYPKASRFLKPGGYLLFTHGNGNDEHVDSMMGESFYYSCLPKANVYQLLVEHGFSVEYMHKDYLENGTHRSLVVLARKK